MYFLGLDVGTKNIKAVILDEDGKIIEKASTPIYDLVRRPREGFVERDPLELWNRVLETLKRLKNISKVSGLCVDATSGTIVPIDVNGVPLYPLIMYNDRRAVKEAEELKMRSSAASEFEKFLPITPTLVLPKLMWLKKYLNNFGRVFKVLHESDYIVYKLTGVIATSANTAGKSHALLKGRGYLVEAYNDVEIPVELMPEIKEIGEIIGKVSAKASKLTGIPEGTPVVNGMTDASAGDITSGAISPGQAGVTIGTSLTLHAVVDKVVPDPDKRFYYKVYVGGNYLAGGFTNAGTTAFDTISKLFNKSLEELTKLAENVPLGSNGLISCTEWYGVRVPKTYPGLQGFIIGLSENNANPGAIFRSLLEGSAATLKLLLNAVEETTGVKILDIRVSGGASRNKLFMQILADVLNREIKVVAEPDSAIGSAILAASSILNEKIKKLVSKSIEISNVFYPRSYLSKKYSYLVEKYKEVVNALGSILMPLK